MTDIRDEVAAALHEVRGDATWTTTGEQADRTLAALAARGLTVVREGELTVERVRAEYQRFYDFVGEADPALVDAWHFGENLRLARQPEGQ